jgi:hypothetical protein
LLNTEGKAAETAYRQVVELLTTRDDAEQTLFKVLRSASSEDIGQRWCALFVVGDIGRKTAGEQLFRAAVESLPKSCHDDKDFVGCEGPRDGEILVRTMAVEALQRVAERHEEVAEFVVKLVAARPDQAVLIEAVKASRALNLTDKVREVLRKEDHWMLDIRIQPVTEVMAAPERGDDTALGYTPPNTKTVRTAPAADCCNPKREG